MSIPVTDTEIKQDEAFLVTLNTMSEQAKALTAAYQDAGRTFARIPHDWRLGYAAKMSLLMFDLSEDTRMAAELLSKKIAYARTQWDGRPGDEPA